MNICLINNFNYSKYLPDCLNSVFSQTKQFDKVIIVDDGSTDSSKEIISSYQKSHANLHALLQSNGGQLSTFNSALPMIDDNSQIFFLDADDIYPEDYLEQFQKIIGENYPDFTYCIPKSFTNDEISKVTTSLVGNHKPEVFYKSSALVRSRSVWIGNQTSCLSISSILYKKIFPYPIPQDFVTKADAVIVHAASILGSKKIFIPSLQIGYRTHLENFYFGKTISKEESRIFSLAVDRLFKWYCTQYSIELHPSISEFYAELKMLSDKQKDALKIPGNLTILKRLIGRRYIWPILTYVKIHL